jgi:hypothetical protein
MPQVLPRALILVLLLALLLDLLLPDVRNNAIVEFSRVLGWRKCEKRKKADSDFPAPSAHEIGHGSVVSSIFYSQGSQFTRAVFLFFSFTNILIQKCKC